jgi:hypothetical protein
MTDYMHHVPGRLRVRSRALRCTSPERNTTLRELRRLRGVRSLRLNPKAGSVTVFYDTGETDAQQILDFIDASCLRTRPAVPVRASSSGEQNGAPLFGDIGRMALGVLVNKGVSYSLSSLLGARV